METGNRIAHAIKYVPKALKKLLLGGGFDVNVKLVERGYTAVHLACAVGNVESLNILISAASASLNSRDSDGKTPLLVAVENNHYDIVDTLLNYCVDVNAGSFTGDTPLLVAIRNKADRIALRILSEEAVRCGPSVLTEANNYTFSPVCEALSKYSYTILDAIDSHWFSEKLNFRGDTPMIFCAKNNLHDAISYMITVKSVQVDAANRMGRTPLYYAAARGHVSVIRTILKRGSVIVDPEVKDMRGITPLMAAAMNGHPPCVKKLLKYASPDETDAEGNTPLMWAVRMGHTACAHIIAEYTRVTSLFVKNLAGLHVLHVAVSLNNHEMVDMLLRKGFAGGPMLEDLTANGMSSLLHYSVNDSSLTSILLETGKMALVPNKCGATPLHVAAQLNDETLDILLNHGKHLVNASNCFGETALFCAAALNRKEAVKLLLRHEADVNVPNFYGITPLIAAASQGYVDVTAMLVDADADLYATDYKKCNALMQAVSGKSCNPEVVKLILYSERSEHREFELIRAQSHTGDNVIHLLAMKWPASSCAADILITRAFACKQKTGYDAINAAGGTKRRTPLMYAADRDDDDILLRMLIEEGEAKVDVTDFDSKTPLMIAMEKGNVSAVRYLLTRTPRAVILQKDEEGHTALTRAAFKGMPDDIISTLLAPNIIEEEERSSSSSSSSLLSSTYLSPSSSSSSSSTPPPHEGHDEEDILFALELASSGGHLKIVKLLIEYQQQHQQHPRYISMKNRDENSCLHLAVLGGHEVLVDYLLSALPHKVIDQANALGNTPLMLAAMQNETDIALLLIKEGRADVSSHINNDGKTLLELATRYSNTSVVKHVLRAHAFSAQDKTMAWRLSGKEARSAMGKLLLSF